MITDPEQSIELVDAHCHVDLFPDPPALARLVENRRVHTIAVTNAPSVFEHTENLARGSHFLHAAVGLHPELVATHGHEVTRMWPLLERTRFVGEIGLDYTTPDTEVRASQRTIFAEILEKCATHKDKIITVHSRRAAADTIAAIGDKYPGRVILHWFTGSLRELERGLSRGLFFSVNVAMVNSPRGRALVNAIPKERILTESDGPFVRSASGVATPESANLVVRYLATLWRIDENTAATIVRNNLFESLHTPGR